MVDFIDFFRIFDFSTWGEGPNGRFYIEFFDFSTLEEGLNGRFFRSFSTFRLVDLGGRVYMVDDCNDFFRLFDFSTRRRGSKWSILLIFFLEISTFRPGGTV